MKNGIRPRNGKLTGDAPAGGNLLLSVEDLTVAFPGVGDVVRSVSCELGTGDTLGIVGESGSGKSMLARALMHLLPEQARIVSGSMKFKGREMRDLGSREIRTIRGSGIGMVFQEPMTSLNPAMSIGAQIIEGLSVQPGFDRQTADRRIQEMLERVRIADPRACLHQYPHEFSGGMRQRIMLASVLLMQPDLLIADEPTTALDAIIQREVLEIMSEITRDLGVSVILISHDLGVVGSYTQELIVMQTGRVVERGATSIILSRPQHEYTRSLIESLPSRSNSWDRKVRGTEGEPQLVRVENLKVSFGRRSILPWVRTTRTDALKGVSLDIAPGETVAVVGESGSGKTTLGRAMLKLVEPAEGTIRFGEQDIAHLTGHQLMKLRRRAQIVFQDPYSSLDPRRRISEIVSEGLRNVHGVKSSLYRERAAEVLEEVDLSATFLDRFPHQLSGGQRQRVCIARALIMRPSLVVADEPVSALDITVQAKILDLMKRLQDEHGFAYLFISHDLGVVEQIANRVIVMHAGRVVEQGSRDQIFDRPHHPYTRMLLQAVPDLRCNPDGSYQIGQRDYPGPLSAPEGMVFDWPDEGGRAASGPARLVRVDEGHLVSCCTATFTPA